MELDHTNMVLLFFIYGLAFFVMGVAVALETRRGSGLKLAGPLRYLAAFGIIHGSAQWVMMFLLIEFNGSLPDADSWARILALSLSALSAVMLLTFGIQLIATRSGRATPFQWLAVALFAAWIVSFTVPQAYGAYASLSVSRTANAECLSCHWDNSSAYIGASKEWLTSADIWSKYLLFLPGASIAAVGLLSQVSVLQSMRMPQIARYAGWGGVAFLCLAFASGLIVPPAPYPPASVLNYAEFAERTGVPPQILWALIAIAIAFFIIRMLNLFEIERRRQLDAVEAQQMRARREALEAEVRAREAERMAVLEERERIAREMHDSLAQSVGFIGLKANIAGELLRGGDAPSGLEEVSAIEEAAQAAYAEVRASILELRSKALKERGLLEALRDYLAKFGHEANLDAGIVVEDGASTRFPPRVEVQLIRIIQEALANVRKHGQATHATVRFGGINGAHLIVVEDDGQGFEPAGVGKLAGNHFGLETMRERAESIGGRFRIESQPGTGTRVVVTLPDEMKGAEHATRESPAGR